MVPMLFMYHMFGGLIFMILADAFVLTHLAEKLRPPGRMLLVGGYLGMAVLFFGYFYPNWTALPLSQPAYYISTGTPIWGVVAGGHMPPWSVNWLIGG